MNLPNRAYYDSDADYFSAEVDYYRDLYNKTITQLSDIANLAEARKAELQAVWAEHFLLSREGILLKKENATLLKERISLSRDVQRLTRELAEARAAMLVEPRVWQD